uniref:Uncharacterized protein n=1 Tax=Cannabis sativa TaxID=3483 RepID=A0A803NSR6_CANSA
MASQVTVYFHKLPMTSSCRGEKNNSFLAAFSMDRAPISCRVPKPMENVKKPSPAKKVGRGKSVKDVLRLLMVIFAKEIEVTLTSQTLRGRKVMGGASVENNEHLLLRLRLAGRCRTPFAFSKKARSDNIRVSKENLNPFLKEHGNTQLSPLGAQPPLPGVQPQQDLKALIMESIREYQTSTSIFILGYHKPYLAFYDQIMFLPNYVRQKFEKFDGINGSSHEHLAYFTSACGKSAQSDALLIRQFMQSLKEVAFTWHTQLPSGSINTLIT